MESKDRAQKIASHSSMRKNKDPEIGSNVLPTKVNSRKHSPKVFTPVDSPKVPTPKSSSPKPDFYSKKEPSSMLRLLSSRATDSKVSASMPASPFLNQDSGTSSGDSDNEMPVCLQLYDIFYFNFIAFSSLQLLHFD